MTGMMMVSSTSTMPSLQIIPRILTLMEMDMETTPVVIQEINSSTRVLNGRTQMVMAMGTIKPQGRLNLIDVQARMEPQQRTDSDAQIQMEMDILIPHRDTLPTLKV
jgi:hypothetical protein